MSAAQGLEIPNPKSLIIPSSQIPPPEQQVHCENEKSEGSYEGNYFKEVSDEGLHVA
jgi:hypothetical protein